MIKKTNVWLLLLLVVDVMIHKKHSTNILTMSLSRRCRCRRRRAVRKAILGKQLLTCDFRRNHRYLECLISLLLCVDVR